MRSHEALGGRFDQGGVGGLGHQQGGRNEEHDLIARYANRLARFEFRIITENNKGKGQIEDKDILLWP